MPNRLRVIRVLLQDVLGNQRWNGQAHACVTMPTSTYWGVEDAMAAILERAVRAVRAVDWPRLLREASARHLHLHSDDEPDSSDWNVASGVCGECLAEAMLADDTGAQDWERHPTSPREYEGRDWSAVVAAHFHHRGAAHWHPFQDRPAVNG